MGIWASVEVEGNKDIYLTSNRDYSKAIATFLGPLDIYCFFVKEPHDLDKEESWYREVIQWFSALTLENVERLNIFEQASYSEWEYTEAEYDKFLSSYAPNTDPKDILTKEEFINCCRRAESVWTDIHLFQQALDELVKRLDETRPQETWWYTEEDTLVDLLLLANALETAVKQGYRQVRIRYS